MPGVPLDRPAFFNYYLSVVINLKKTAFAAALLFTQPFHAQYRFYIDNSTHGSVYAGPAMISIKEVKPVPGFVIQYESGISHWRGSGIFLSSLYKSSAGQRMGNVVGKYYAGQKMTVPFDVHCGYSSFSVQFRYYLFDTQEISGHNFFGGAGMSYQVLRSKFSNGQYDKDLYQPVDNSTLAEKDFISITSDGFGLNAGAGYQYFFDSGFGLFTNVNYEFSLLGVNRDENYDLVPGNVISATAGVKYVFEYKNFMFRQ